MLPWSGRKGMICEVPLRDGLRNEKNSPSLKSLETTRFAERLVGHEGSSFVLPSGWCEDLTMKKARCQNNT